MLLPFPALKVLIGSAKHGAEGMYSPLALARVPLEKTIQGSGARCSSDVLLSGVGLSVCFPPERGLFLRMG